MPTKRQKNGLCKDYANVKQAQDGPNGAILGAFALG